MPRVLIVTSMYLPFQAADSHRARHLAQHLPSQGWDVELLVPAGDFQLADYFEPHAQLLALPVAVHFATQRWSAFFRLLNWRSLGWRAYLPMKRLGASLLSSGRFDLVYFSCSQANLFHLGVAWRGRFGTPFVIDFHDPWYVPALPTSSLPPTLKRRITNVLARYLERATVREAAGIVSVSPTYLETVNARYSGRHWQALAPERQVVIPFAASEEDYDAAGLVPGPRRPAPPTADRTVVYTGAGGEIMRASFSFLCRLLAEVRRQAPELLAGLQIRLLGTEPSAVARSPVLSRVIADFGLTDLIVEHPARVSYLEALREVAEADGLLILGVDDPAYCPSKLFLYALSGRPLLACMITGSAVDVSFENCPELGSLVHFCTETSGPNSDDVDRLSEFLRDVASRRSMQRRGTLDEWLGPSMATRHIGLFERCLGAGRPA